MNVDVPPLLVVAILLFVLFVWRQISLNQKDGQSGAIPPLTPKRLFAKNRLELLAIYVSALFIWAGVDVSAILFDKDPMLIRTLNLAVFGAYFYFEVLDLSGWQAGLRVAPNTFGGLIASVHLSLFRPSDTDYCRSS